MFEDLGYYKEYYVNKKFIGTLICEKDRELIGYEGRKTEITTEIITLKNKKVIKKGVEVRTILYPLCGKMI